MDRTKWKRESQINLMEDKVEKPKPNYTNGQAKWKRESQVI